MLPDLIHKLLQLLPLALAEIKEADSDAAGIVDCLRHAREAKRQSIDAKLDFNTAENSHRKWPAGANAAATETDIDNASVYVCCQADKADDNAAIDLLSRLKTASQMRILSRICEPRLLQGRRDHRNLRL